MKQILRISVLLFAVLSLATVPTSVNAADAPSGSSESILLSPTSKRYNIDAGATKTDTFKVVNDGSKQLTFVVYARPFSVTNEKYDAQYEIAGKNADIYKWVQFDTPSFVLEPGQSVDVPYTIRVPKNAAPGGHYGVLFAETQITETASGTSIAQKKRVGAILYTTVNGDVRTSGSFVDSDVPLFQSQAPLAARQRISNSGNTDFVVKSSIAIKDVFGGLKYKYEKDSTVLPSTTRLISNDWATPSWIGIYKVEQTAKFLDTSKMTTNYVVLVPLWVYLTVALLIGGRVLYALSNRNKKK